MSSSGACDLGLARFTARGSATTRSFGSLGSFSWRTGLSPTTTRTDEIAAAVVVNENRPSGSGIVALTTPPWRSRNSTSTGASGGRPP